MAALEHRTRGQPVNSHLVKIFFVPLSVLKGIDFTAGIMFILFQGTKPQMEVT